MILKKAKYKKVMHEVRERVSNDILGCDQCAKEFDEEDKLLLTIFRKSKTKEVVSTNRVFCCWKCVFEFIPKIKSNYFVSLPFLHYDSTRPNGILAKDFIKLIK